MPSLFVSDDAEVEVTVKQEEEEILMEVDEEVTEKEEEETEDDDPVLREIPIHLNTTDPQKLDLMLLQYTTRKNSGGSVPTSIEYKPNSKVVEMELPFEQTKFFNEDKSKGWNKLEGQMLRGVVCRNETSGYFMGRVGQDGELYFNPITGGTAQLRPSFRYIDDLRQKKIQKEAEEAKQLANDSSTKVIGERERQGNLAAARAAALHVVQMTAKSSNQTIPRLGGALLSKKQEDDETAETYEVLPREKYDVKQMEMQLGGSDSDAAVLKPAATQAEYIEMLMKKMGI
ncbi:hypothetical protein FOA43_002325 [Brettanomyces nanus]|uniref:Uncharacterized protein n=1 Tax=Eeniella nana TaxID=13502 RepID=A0A875S3N7_EENNA|nr:uncharacterized protein FOA43_002325 [Brettanomyces nanus]QPG74985.1 hypothetical protein FOA43_002325 [Brettanomyces nanus]